MFQSVRFHMMPYDLLLSTGFVQDLQSAVERISLFLGKQLTDKELANVVKHSTFNNMRKIPQANYEQVPVDLLNHHQGKFMRKGWYGYS